MKVFSINGYWREDNEPFNNYLVSNEGFDDDRPESFPPGLNDDNIFYYDLTEREIQEEIANPDKGGLEFVITSYELYDQTN